ncbi:MAG TPA: amidohydrolase family protein [Vicinamibacterales bacterium]|nr:amidohydrolase family protein [Vicinamibacterales bacterium]
MKRFLITALTVTLAAVAISSAQGPSAPTYAIRGAKIVPVSGGEIASGNIVLRNGLIEAVGANAAIPNDAIVIDGTGLTVYPGLIDMGNASVIDSGAAPAAGGRGGAPAAPGQSREDTERAKRDRLLRADYMAAANLRLEGAELTRLASAGITSVLATPGGTIFRGQSALVNVIAPQDDPQISALADIRKTMTVVQSPVALHVNFQPGGGPYPASLMGAIAFVRQAFSDAAWQRQALAHYEKNVAVPRPVWDPALEGLFPAIDRRIPVAFDADEAREIARVLRLAKELNVNPIITGAREAADMAAELKAANAPVIYSLNYPVRPRTLPPDADESLAALRARADAPKAPAALAKAGVTFAFETGGLAQPRDFVRNAARAVKEGLPADAALRALTLDAAKIAGADRRLGSLDRGKIANVLVTEGDLFGEKMTIKHVFVDGHKVVLDAAPAPGAGRGGRGGARN